MPGRNPAALRAFDSSWANPLQKKGRFLLTKKMGWIWAFGVSYRLLLVPTKKKEKKRTKWKIRKIIHISLAMLLNHKKKESLEFQAFHWEETTYSSAVLLPCDGWSAGGDTNTSTPTSFAIDVCLGPRRMLMAPLQSTMEKPRPSCNRKGERILQITDRISPKRW